MGNETRGIARARVARTALVIAACTVGAAAATASGATTDAARNSQLSWGVSQVLVAPPGALPYRTQAWVFNRLSLLYETDQGVRGIIDGSASMQALPWLQRIEPSTSGPGATLGTGNEQRMVKVSGAALAAQRTAGGMAAMLRGAIDRTCTTPAGVSTCLSHRVVVDEIDSRYGGRNGTSSATGARLRTAMQDLARRASPWGGSYASRVHFALAPGPATSVAAGFGRNRTLGRNGLPIRRNYRHAFAGMALGAGVWMQMYHYSRSAGLTGFTPAEWRDVPTGVAGFLSEVRSTRNPLTYLHFMLTTTPGMGLPPGDPCGMPGVPGGPGITAVAACVPAPSSCRVLPWRTRTQLPAYGRALVVARARKDAAVARRAATLMTPVDPGSPQVIRQPVDSPMACQWARAQSGAVNTRLLMNGPGAYRLEGNQAITWGRLFRQFFVVP
jgi:hypothetical protein